VTNFLELSAVHDATDRSMELELKFLCDGFSGQGMAYFNATHLLSIAESLRTFPLPSEVPITVEGGYFEPEQVDVLRERHVLLRFAAGKSSPVELHVGAGVAWDHQQGLRRWAEATFLIDYEQLSVLSRAIESLAMAKESTVKVDLPTFR